MSEATYLLEKLATTSESQRNWEQRALAAEAEVERLRTEHEVHESYIRSLTSELADADYRQRQYGWLCVDCATPEKLATSTQDLIKRAEAAEARVAVLEEQVQRLPKEYEVYAQGAAAERARIVADLRTQTGLATCLTREGLALRYERGDHLKARDGGE